MSGSNILEIATGIIFIFILVSAIYSVYPGRVIHQLLYNMGGTGLTKAHLPAAMVNINATPDPPTAGGDTGDAAGQNPQANDPSLQDLPDGDDEPDGCDVEATDLTGDADLPESKGGMI
ncbi:hypothetical protein [Mucilaginibacter sp.]|uniref:hypothetical protein n=1 Tax=Mucilaginibacter sp. TaxID=1882438 RepID=UPI0026229D7C|nr:hypothetical protein [Mucilaginibacter sp.]MDB4923126.1 hypothetical protein [Mucilaginibacter sp.]